ncbi:MAG TPA: FliM/FliN family flagellar motor switch protein [Thermoleophilaceae bacterium]
MSNDRALERLVEVTVEAVSGVLETLCPGAVELGGISVESSDLDPLGAIPPPIVACSVSFVDGVTGGNVFAIPLEGARALAAAMMGGDPPADGGEPELSELELSAVGEAMNQMMSAAAAAAGATVGQEVHISPPEVGTFASSQEVMEAMTEDGRVARAHFSVLGAPSRLILVVPNAFVVRMTRALDERGGELADTGEEPAVPAGEADLEQSLRDVPVRVWAELGRVRMQTGRVVGMPAGAVVELDRRADDPVDVYVNGLRFATGRLIVVDETEWAVKIESVVPAGAGVPEREVVE